jgi:hypothetical protein
LTNLPLTFRQLTRLAGLVLTGNPLEFPPQEVVEQGTWSVVAYFQRPQPPLEVGVSWWGVLAGWLVSLVGMVWGWLRWQA